MTCFQTVTLYQISLTLRTETMAVKIPMYCVAQLNTKVCNFKVHFIIIPSYFHPFNKSSMSSNDGGKYTVTVM